MLCYVISRADAVLSQRMHDKCDSPLRSLRWNLRRSRRCGWYGALATIMQTPPGTLDLRLNLLHYLRRQATITAVLFARRITKLNVHWRNGWAPCETGLAGRSIFTCSQPRVLAVLPHNSDPPFLTQFVPPSRCWNLTNTAMPKVGKHSDSAHHFLSLANLTFDPLTSDLFDLKP